MCGLIFCAEHSTGRRRLDAEALPCDDGPYFVRVCDKCKSIDPAASLTPPASLNAAAPASVGPAVAAGDATPVDPPTTQPIPPITTPSVSQRLPRRVSTDPASAVADPASAVVQPPLPLPSSHVYAPPPLVGSIHGAPQWIYAASEHMQHRPPQSWVHPAGQTADHGWPRMAAAGWSSNQPRPCDPGWTPWRECWDPRTCQKYYWNVVTGQVEWELPVPVVELPVPVAAPHPSVRPDVGFPHTAAEPHVYAPLPEPNQHGTSTIRRMQSLVQHRTPYPAMPPTQTAAAAEPQPSRQPPRSRSQPNRRRSEIESVCSELQQKQRELAELERKTMMLLQEQHDDCDSDGSPEKPTARQPADAREPAEADASEPAEAGASEVAAPAAVLLTVEAQGSAADSAGPSTAPLSAAHAGAALRRESSEQSADLPLSYDSDEELKVKLKMEALKLHGHSNVADDSSLKAALAAAAVADAYQAAEVQGLPAAACSAAAAAANTAVKAGLTAVSVSRVAKAAGGAYNAALKSGQSPTAAKAAARGAARELMPDA